MTQAIDTLLFDVNETLLDLEALTPLFSRIFGREEAMREWFAQQVLYSQALTLSHRYAPFNELAAGTLRMLGEIHGVTVSSEDMDEIRAGMSLLPPHPEAAEALARLKGAGFRLATLTNSPPSPGSSPLEKAGLSGYFEQMFSVHQWQRFKPAPEPYRGVAQAMQVELSSMCLVAAHTWDTLGAQSLGSAGALVTRGANAPLAVKGVPQPDIVVKDLKELADSVLRVWR